MAVFWFVCGSIVTGWLAWLWILEHRRVIQAFVDSEVDYMKLNNLGDPEEQSKIKWARRILNSHSGGQNEPASSDE